MKYDVIVADPPWSFSDTLKMSTVKRGAESHYDVMTNQDIKDLDVGKIAADDAVLVLWVPSSMLQDGLDVMKAWGFDQKQTFVWVKTKKDPLPKMFKGAMDKPFTFSKANILDTLSKLDLNGVLNFFMGRLFRQTHEIALVGVRGKVYSKLENKSQRSVLLDINLKHSAKPEGLQDRLDLMFPKRKKLEMFARRAKLGWECVGLECPSTPGEDIRKSIERLIKKK